MRWEARPAVAGLAVAAMLLGACDGSGPSDDRGQAFPSDCPRPPTLARAPSLAGVKEALRHRYPRDLRTLRTQGTAKTREAGRLIIDGRDAKGRFTRQFEVLRRPDGTWIAREPWACM